MAKKKEWVVIEESLPLGDENAPVHKEIKKFSKFSDAKKYFHELEQNYKWYKYALDDDTSDYTEQNALDYSFFNNAVGDDETVRLFLEQAESEVKEGVTVKAKIHVELFEEDGKQCARIVADGESDECYTLKTLDALPSVFENYLDKHVF